MCTAVSILGYIAETDSNLLKFDLSPGQKGFFRSLSEFGLTHAFFSVRDVEQYLGKKRTVAEVRRGVRKRPRMKYKNVRQYFIALEAAKLIEKATGVLPRHPLEKLFKISTLGWICFWSRVANRERTYREIIVDRYDTDPVVKSFIKPYFEKKTVEALIHDIYFFDEYLSPGPFPRYLAEACQSLTLDFLNSSYNENLFQGYIRHRTKRFILDQVLLLGFEPNSFMVMGKSKDKKIEKSFVKSQVEAIRWIGHERGAIFGRDDKFMALFEELDMEFRIGKSYLADESMKKVLAFAQLPKVNSS